MDYAANINNMEEKRYTAGDPHPTLEGLFFRCYSGKYEYWGTREENRIINQTRRVSVCEKSKKPIHKTILKIRNSTRNIMLLKYRSRARHWLGCTGKEFRAHIESQFQDGMNWDNYGSGRGKWSLDHIIPLSIAKTDEDAFQLGHFKNVQPLWFSENSRKGDKRNFPLKAIQSKSRI